ncbi:DUF397 domain-containing protein [Actinomadura sp. CNU-125]|uniref:DUF397 domain-containing protein n=1 Tax=Actinomadura sp. CNU-125 TaxID=1904961 RepID=UPI00096A93EC|nr:DUF397 domain-containing protein [Actinomadura sp. CNU-125]
MDARPTKVRWRKSSYSGGTGECVEVAGLVATIGVRDSKAPDTNHLSCRPEAWVQFVSDVRGGRFDLS